MKKRIHFIAIGGSIMHQLAITLHRDGYDISGSDDTIFEPAKTNLEKNNLLPTQYGWDANRINKNIDVIILGMHAKADNPELLKAQELNIPIYSFPEYIFEATQNKTKIIIAGSHGKTSTTAMIMHVLKHQNIQFDFLVGAALKGFDNSVYLNDSNKILVAEGDEYLSSALQPIPKFLFYKANIAIITGIAWDHINVFPTFQKYLNAFEQFIQSITPNGILIYNALDKTLVEIVTKNNRKDLTLIPYHTPQHHIDNNGITHVNIDNINTSLNIFGEHNLQNLTAAFYACKQLNISTKQFLNNISFFTGAAKRLELIKETSAYKIYRDFAHAPSKLKASLNALKTQFKNKKLIVIFELHTYSSLNVEFLQQYKNCLDAADEKIVFCSKKTLQQKNKNSLIHASIIKNAFANDNILYYDDAHTLLQQLKSYTFDNTILALMSSGNFDNINFVNEL